MSNTDRLEDLKDERSVYRLVLNSTELLIQLSGARNMSLLETLRDVKSTLRELDEAIHKEELRQMNPGL